MKQNGYELNESYANTSLWQLTTISTMFEDPQTDNWIPEYIIGLVAIKSIVISSL